MQDLATLYESIGGPEAVASVIEEFYERVLADAELAHFFDGVALGPVMAHQQAFLSAAFDGPERYAGRPLREAHAGLKITDAQFERLTQHLFETLRGLGAEDAHLRALERRISSFRADIVGA